MRKWAPIFKPKCVNEGRKIHLMIMSVWASVLWRSALWTQTKTMNSAIDSWSVRTICVVLVIKKGAEQAMDQWWRRLHRAGHAALKSRDQSLSCLTERLILRWEDTSRLPTNHWLAEVVRGRDVQCWRWAQQRHTEAVGGSVVPLAQRRVHEEPRGEHRVVERRPRPSVLTTFGTAGLV